MQNEKNDTHSLTVEKVIKKTPAEVFRAIGEGRLFLNCGANQDALKIDFKVGGKYSIFFANYEMHNQGEFLEIIPNEKIVFTWCQDYEANPKPDTTVTITLKNLNDQTALTVVHTGFKTQESANNHNGGWNTGLGDLSLEMTEGRLKLIRLFNMPMPKLFELFKKPETIFGNIGDIKNGSVDFKTNGHYSVPTHGGVVSGKITEVAPDQKIAFTWTSTCAPAVTNESKVTITFDTEEDDQSWAELTHEGLMTEAQQKKIRESWDFILNQLAKS